MPNTSITDSELQLTRCPARHRDSPTAVITSSVGPNDSMASYSSYSTYSSSSCSTSPTSSSDAASNNTRRYPYSSDDAQQQQQRQQRQRFQEQKQEEEEEELVKAPLKIETPPSVYEVPSRVIGTERNPASASAASVLTYDSAYSVDLDDDVVDDDDQDDEHTNGGTIITSCSHQQQDQSPQILPNPSTAAIPSALPTYRASITDPNVRTSNPEAFGHFFPSLDRLSIRHDEFTPDGNMNLRVDTMVKPKRRSSRSGSVSDGRPISIQLFHLRMHDLARREFSLRRYARDSGREVCNSKRAYVASSNGRGGNGSGNVSGSHNNLPRSISSALRSVKSPFKRPGSSSASHEDDDTTTAIASTRSNASTSSRSTTRRPSVSSWSSRASESPGNGGPFNFNASPSPPRLIPTDTIRLEFSNYARVDVTRRTKRGKDGGGNNKNNGGSGVSNKKTRYEFEWWGNKYSWRRVVDCNVEGGPVSYHLIRGKGKNKMAVAHIVPETLSPSQVAAEEKAGGWIPPYYFWISDPSVVNALTDVADVIIATGLISLVDDSIKQRWQPTTTKKPIRRHASLRGDDLRNGNYGSGSGTERHPISHQNSFQNSIAGSSARKIMHGIFHKHQRRHSDHQRHQQQQQSPLRTAVAC